MSRMSNRDIDGGIEDIRFSGSEELPDKRRQVRSTWLLRDIRSVAEMLGHPPSTGEYQKYGNHSRSTIYDRFDEWKNAVYLAGLDPDYIPGDDLYVGSDISEEACLYEVVRADKQVEGPLTRKEWGEIGKWASKFVQEKLGTESWKEVVLKLGYTEEEYVAKIGHDPGSRRIPVEELLTELRMAAIAIGRPPKVDEMNAYGEYSGSTYQSRFESWSEALEAAGVSTEEEVEKQIAEFERELEEVPQTPE